MKLGHKYPKEFLCQRLKEIHKELKEYKKLNSQYNQYLSEWISGVHDVETRNEIRKKNEVVINKIYELKYLSNFFNKKLNQFYNPHNEKK